MWKEYVEHTFVKGLGKGLLDKRCFVHFIKYFFFFFYKLRFMDLLFSIGKTTTTSNITQEPLRAWD